MNVPILDTHQHLICPERLTYSWTDGIPQLAQRSFSYDDYVRGIAGKGEVRTIFMETAPDMWRDEARLAIALADDSDTIIDGLVLNCRPEEGEMEAYLATVNHPKLVGLRRILHAMPDALSQQTRFVENVRKLARHDLTFDLCLLARQLRLGYELARKCPEVRFVLDHCGVPDIAGGALDPWRDRIRELASCDNIACKISGVLAYCAPGNATAESVRPYVEHCIESFGWDRVVWGSDWPVVCMRSDLPHWIDVSRELLRGESENHQRRLFHGNAERIYLKREA